MLDSVLKLSDGFIGVYMKYYSCSCQRELAFFVLLLSMITGLSAPNPRESTILRNKYLSIGVDLKAGAAINFLAPEPSRENVINGFDLGRFVQQSYYGRQDGSRWNNKAWNWNPVQGGSYNGNPSKVVESANSGTQIYAKTIPRHWATGSELTNVVMEEWITLEDRVAHIHYRMTYKGVTSHPDRNQELPAVFLSPRFKNLVYYNGDNPWENDPLTRRVPSSKNTRDSITENWAAYVNDQNWGVGVYVPGATQMTFYLVQGGAAGCAYLAPVESFAITAKTVFEYDVYLRTAALKDIRSSFYRLHEQLESAQFTPTGTR